MKKTLILGLFGLHFLNTIVNAQQQNCIDKNSQIINTYPLNSVNNQYPIKKNTYFDWTISPLKVYSQSIDPPYLQNPFFQTNNSALDYLVISKDYKNSDGWELIRHDMGTDDAGNNTYKNGHPLFILYNKYTGLMRVFVAVGEKHSGYSSMQMELNFRSGTSTSALNLGTGQTALDKFSTNPVMLCPTNFKDEYGSWFVGEFVMTYDPCTCGVTSMMTIAVKLIQKASIILSGSITGTAVSKSLEQRASGEGNQTFINNAISKLSIGNLKTGAKKAVETYESIDKWVKEQKDSYADKSVLPPNFMIEKTNSLNSFQSILKDSKFLQAGLGSIPYVGAAVGLVSTFVSGGKSSSSIEPTNVSITPISINLTSEYKGEIVETTPIKSLSFYTPGSNFSSYQSIINDFYPFYNKTTGVFNLLTTPKYKNNNYTTNDVEYIITGATLNPNLPPYIFPIYSNSPYTKENIQFNCSSCNNLDFAINEDAGLSTSEYEILGALLFNIKLESGEVFPSDLNQKGLIVDFQSDNVITVRTPYMNINVLKDMFITFTSKYVHYVFDSKAMANNLVTDNFGYPKDAHLKVLVNLKRKDATPNTQNIIYVGTYPIDRDGDATTSVGGLIGSWNNCPNTLVIDRMIPCENVKAYDKVILNSPIQYRRRSGNCSIADYIITAGNEIIISNEVELRNNIDFQSITLATVAHPKAMNESSIRDYCSSKYNITNRNVRSTSQNYNETKELETLNNNKEVLFHLGPNPTNSHINLYISNACEGSINILIKDVTGKLALAFSTKYDSKDNDLSCTFDVSSLSCGIYFISVETNSQKSTQKLVISK